MQGVDLRKAKEIFGEALDMSPEDRTAYLDRVTAGDTGLRGIVVGLLESAARNGEFLADATAGPIGEARDGTARAMHIVGTRIGAYTIVEKVGEGGFGEVYVAEQSEPVQRRVALKIIKPGMDTRAVVARFEQERQALALMDHPNIAKVFDAGATDTGRPYFVMELVQGEAITAYCDRHHLSIEDRLGLFVQVCRAVQHAHTKGIIHRDLKPSNVLVSTQDGRPTTRVIDFGIAKATERRLTEKTVFTELRQLMGTPEYMSPEQAEGSFDIDTRTDVYSLGVLLYELLTGSTPFEPSRLRSAAYAEIQRIIREIEPPKPSTRLSQGGDLVAGVAACRRAQPSHLGARVRGELDWIAMKALEKDRGRRYESASDLAADVERHLAGQTVRAAPPSKAYLLRKFLRRNRTAVLAGLAITTVLLGATVASTVFALREREARGREARERVSSDRIVEFMNSMFMGLDPFRAKGRDVSVLREMLDDAATRLEAGELAAAPVAEFRLRVQMCNAYRGISEYQRASDVLAPADALLQGHLSDDASARISLLEARASLARDLGQFQEAIDFSLEAIESRRRATGPDDPALAWTFAALVTDYQNLPDHQKAVDAGVEALRVAAIAGTERRLMADVHTTISQSLQHLGRGDEAMRHVELAVAIYKILPPTDDVEYARNQLTLALVHLNSQRLDEAEAFLKEADRIYRRHDPRGKDMVGVGLAWVVVDLRRKQFEQGAARMREALDICHEIYPEPHITTSIVLLNLGECLTGAQRFAEAAEAYREGDAVVCKVFSPEHPQRMVVLLGQIESLRALDRHAEAVELLGTRMKLVEASKKRPHAILCFNEALTASSLAALGRYADAEPLALRAYQEMQQVERRRWPARLEQTVVGALAEVYEGWNTAEPGQGHDAKAAAWKAKLDAIGPS